MLLQSYIKNYSTYAGIGGLCLAGSLILNRFLPHMPASDILQGLLLGLSLAFNIQFLIQWRRHRTA